MLFDLNFSFGVSLPIFFYFIIRWILFWEFEIQLGMLENRNMLIGG